jgi:TPR repeat protein
MSFFLGVAYHEGVTVPANDVQARHWFERAASAGNRRAQVRLGATR